jgi:hypothetical protein
MFLLAFFRVYSYFVLDSSAAVFDSFIGRELMVAA